MPPADCKRILGLDIGVNSLGWALLNYEDDKPAGVLGAGSHVFEPGMDGDIASGREESRNLPRRSARLIRRQTERRARRQAKLARTLQQLGLLPEGNVEDPAARHAMFETWDRDWLAANRNTIPEPDRHRAANTLPYRLRAESLDRPLEAHELGRALYHLGQRRGFLSNRKGGGDDEEEGKVYGGISELRDEIQAAGARTLGELFSRLDPTDPDGKRIRNRYTHRQMYLDEFEHIWSAQQDHHPEILTEEAKAAVHRAIFFQRKLKSSRELIGLCTYERKDRGCPKDRRRAPAASLEAQRFRIWQNINNLRYRDEAGEMAPLSDEQRMALFAALDCTGSMTWKQVRTACGLDRNSKINLEEGGEKSLKGNTTAGKLIGIFGDAWQALTPEEQQQVVEDVRSYEKEDKLKERGTRRWNLSEDQARAFSRLQLEPDYFSLSRKAIETLTPYLEQGMRTDEAVAAVYGVVVDKPIHETLPPIMDIFPQELRNPTVIRCLTQVRKQVNAIIARYGKPDLIRIELARDLKKNKKQRKSASKRMRDRQGQRDKARKAIGGEPSARDIEKYLLWEECNHECPYTGKSISMRQLFGESPQFDVEHIIPYSRSLDDSFMNKTLCYHEENRSVKRNRTPFEAYSAERLEEIVQRVRRFQGDDYARDAKLRRFAMNEQEVEEALSGFTTTDLNNTRYSNKLAVAYCRLLYGDEATRVQVCAGGVTAQLRNLWSLNGILGDGGLKTREDHRHHAVDALVIALCSPGMVQAVSRDAQAAQKKMGAEGTRRKRLNAYIDPPWENFLNDIRDTVLAINTSVSVDKRVRGALHQESLYSPPRTDENGKSYNVIRKPIEALSSGEVAAIVDPVVRQIIIDELQKRGGDPKKAFAKPEEHPFMKGGALRIHKVRIRKNQTTLAIGEGVRERHVLPASNHHMEILEVTDRKGNPKWQDLIVTQFDALQRKKKRQPIIQREHGEGVRFVMSLSAGDMITLADERGEESLYRVRGISSDLVTFNRINDARIKSEIIAAKEWGVLRTNGLRSRNCRKVAVTRLGEVIPVDE